MANILRISSFLLCAFLNVFAIIQANPVSSATFEGPTSTDGITEKQIVRLRLERDGVRMGMGLIQVYYMGKWGMICQDLFDINDAHVICRQLGFNRGAESILSSNLFAGVIPRRRVAFTLDNLMCRGDEISVLQCKRSLNIDCFRASEAVGVKCKLDHRSVCPNGGHLINSKCYKFHDAMVNQNTAEKNCRKHGGALVSISDSFTSHAISDAIHLLHGRDHLRWHTSGKKASDNKWKWHGVSSSKSTDFTAWTQGSDIEDHQDCIYLHDNSLSDEERGYYRWHPGSCNALRSYICEYDVMHECIIGNGTDYTGSANHTIHGVACLKWNSAVATTNGVAFEGQQQWNHNHCRNPDKDHAPWCITSENHYDFCDLPLCESTIKCKQNEISCGDHTNECISKDFVCDYDKDCTNGFDEQNCTDWLSNFAVQQGQKSNAKPEKVWTFVVHVQGCAQRCIEISSGKCVSMAYMKSIETCYLYTTDTTSGIELTESTNTDYYEIKSRANHRSKSRGVSKEVRLAGGEHEFEGRLEILHQGEWGMVCDDHWDKHDATVVCKELGYGSAVQAVVGSQFGVTPNADFFMDEVECKGSEDSLTECSFGGWKQHDCGPKESAGVICSEMTPECSASQFTCPNGVCIEVQWLCDKQNDCGDNADEQDDICSKPVKVRLVNGSSATSGRLEVQYYGIWGTVCDDDFDANDANVVCHMLGIEGKAVVHKGGQFGRAKGPIWLDDLQCSGHESTIATCKTPVGLGRHDCGHMEDVGISCGVETAPEHGECGHRFKEGVARDPTKAFLARVVGGFTAQHGAYPWNAAVKSLIEKKHHCGATIISDLFLLTAAHCFDNGQNISDFEIRAGEWDNQREDGSEQVFQIQSITMHPDYRNILNDDIAIIEIKPQYGRGMNFSHYVQPICLPAKDAEYREGRRCIVSGWGSVGTQYPRRLQAASLPIIAQSKCAAPDVYGKILGDRTFCAGFLRGGVDSCQGDSGGPYACQIQGRFYLFGVISWGDGCAERQRPGIYTKVVDYIPWIMHTIR